MLEPDKELVAKMLRAVLQSNKNGVPFSRLQSEYKSLTGEYIPFKDLGFHTLEAYIKAIPTVVRIEINRAGEVICHAVVCKETAQIARLVARQRSSKKKSSSQVNCQMRLIYSSPITHFGKPKAILRKPAPQAERVVWKPVLPSVRAKGTVWNSRLPVNLCPLQPAPVYGAGLLREVPVQRHQPISSLYFTVSDRPERKVTLPPRFQKEVNQHLFQQAAVDSNANETHHGKPALLGNFRPNLAVIQSNLRDLFSKHSNGIPLSKLPQIYKEAFKHDLSEEVLKQIVNWTHVCTVQRPVNNQSDIVLHSTARKPNTQKNSQQPINDKVKPNVPSGASKQASPVKSASNPITTDELKAKIFEILSNYSTGLWSHALPKVFEDTFKIAFPNQTFKLEELSDICTIEVISQDPFKGILYAKSPEDVGQNLNLVVNVNKEQQGEVPSCPTHSEVEEPDLQMTIPPLVIPSEASPSVLVAELPVNSTQEVVIRYVGEDYSAAQERMEDEMKEFYSKNAKPVPFGSLKVGQLVAVNAEDEEAWLRAEISTVENNKIKVYYVDHGFSEVVDSGKICRLTESFYALPFQATKCRLAGLEAFCEDPVLLKALESKARDKIFAVEILEKTEKPLVVLYDTSGDDDINVNSAILSELCDRSLSVQLKVNSSYTNVNVTNVCSDGSLFCQIPSKGLTKLNETLQKIESHITSKNVTLDLFVTLPFCGKVCLFHSKGKWARVQITRVHSTRTLDVQFLDSGTIASVKVSELKEIPSQFLRDIISIPSQATRCCLADLPLNIGMWTPDAVLWLRNTVINCAECSIKVMKINEADAMVHVCLFTSKNVGDPERSVNRQIANVELWKLQKSLPCPPAPFSKDKGDPVVHTATPREDQESVTKKSITEQASPSPSLKLPPLLPLPKGNEHMDVFVSVACHPGHFVFQPWQELHKLEMVMEEMLLYYSSNEEKSLDIEKNKIYAAKVDNKWYRVLLKGILTNGLVSVYELDYGRHELVNSRQVQHLIDKFMELPFQAVRAQLAGIECEQWSEEASIVFRNYVENKPLVALIRSVDEGTYSWDRKVVTYLVDTSLPSDDLWVHENIIEFLEFSKPQ